VSTPQDPYGPPGSQPGGPDQPASPPGWGQPGQGQPYGQPGQGQPYGQPVPGGPKRNGLGIAALVLGVLALLGSFTIVFGFILGVVAIVLGLMGRGRARSGQADNGTMAVVGAVLGALAIVLSAVFIAIGVAIFNSDSGRSLVDCLTDAGNDQAAIEQCQREFEDSIGQ
jgi:hypothetical protein